MQKYLLFLFLFICASCIGSKNGVLEQNKIFDIMIDPDRVTDDLDLSCILTDSIEIIKLKSENQKLRLKTNALIEVRERGNIKIIMKHNKFVEQNNRRK